MKLYCVLFCLVGVLAWTTDSNCFFHPTKKKEKGDVHTFGIKSSHPETETIQGKIAGGEEVTTLRSFPFVVDILAYGNRYCSGSIISRRHILTAAHCVSMDDDERLTRGDVRDLPQFVVVRAGSVFRGQGTRIGISDIVLHPYFDEPQNNLDIAYLRTEKPIVFTGEIQPGKLVLGKMPDEVTVVGWGKTGRARYRRLRKVNLAVVGLLRCVVAYAELAITKNMFCAEDTTSLSKGACKGDGGSPASYKGYLFGASSFTKGCGFVMAPSVFTNFQAREVREFITNGTGVKYYQKMTLRPEAHNM